EVAYRMQTAAPDVFDIRKESKATLAMYGPGSTARSCLVAVTLVATRAREMCVPGSTARSCLMAVRLVEKGVRMVQVYYAAGDPWDAHGDLYSQHRKPAFDSDRAFAAVIKDLKSRGLFNDTLVVCGSEFGRTPVAEIGAGGGGLNAGREHKPFWFLMCVSRRAAHGG